MEQVIGNVQARGTSTLPTIDDSTFISEGKLSIEGFIKGSPQVQTETNESYLSREQLNYSEDELALVAQVVTELEASTAFDSKKILACYNLLIESLSQGSMSELKGSVALVVNSIICGRNNPNSLKDSKKGGSKNYVSETLKENMKLINADLKKCIAATGCKTGMSISNFSSLPTILISGIYALQATPLRSTNVNRYPSESLSLYKPENWTSGATNFMAQHFGGVGIRSIAHTLWLWRKLDDENGTSEVSDSYDTAAQMNNAMASVFAIMFWNAVTNKIVVKNTENPDIEDGMFTARAKTYFMYEMTPPERYLAKSSRKDKLSFAVLMSKRAWSISRFVNEAGLNLYKSNSVKVEGTVKAIPLKKENYSNFGKALASMVGSDPYWGLGIVGGEGMRNTVQFSAFGGTNLGPVPTEPVVFDDDEE